MCFVLDINSFHIFFDPSHKKYEEFSPLYDWLHDRNRKTCLVIGGEKYLDELGKIPKYNKYLIELKNIRKLVKIDGKIVDSKAAQLKELEPGNNFDDSHIVALLSVSGCIIFASFDVRADRFISRKDFYPKKQKRPKIYRNARHQKTLLKDENIVELRNVIP